MKYSGNPVLLPSELPWEGKGVSPGGVIKLNGIYHMWYGASRNYGESGEVVTGYATSTDGIHWTKHPDPVFINDSSISFESFTALINDVKLMPNGNFEAMFIGVAADRTARAVGRAVSNNGILWQRDPLNPILEKGDSDEWDGGRILGVTFLRDGDDYRIWYPGQKRDSGSWLIGAATGTFICE